MDTRAEIGVTTEKGTIYSVYCNLNGDVKNAGRILLENYNDYEVYIDRANNKRYFKNGIEDFMMFYDNNGKEAVYHIRTGEGYYKGRR